MPKLSLAIDFDGVIAETLGRKSAWIARRLGMSIPAVDCCKSRCEPLIGAENYRRMSRELGYEDTLECPAFDGAVEGLRQLSEVFSISVYTARPKEKAHWAGEWFRHHELADLIDGVISTYGRSKAALAVAGGSHALVDNDIRHLREETPASTRRVFFSPGGNTGGEEGVITVSGWTGLVDVLLPGHASAA